MIYKPYKQRCWTKVEYDEREVEKVYKEMQVNRRALLIISYSKSAFLLLLGFF